jgi:hypothetical protein
MKVVYCIVAALALASCSKKDQAVEPTSTQKVFMRIEAVEPTGDTTFSKVVFVNY